ncbi:MAG: C-type lectin domain-containing protein [Bacteroidales bacterium]|jgi:hypothetical protein|nr:C-type lectin domain-containing protein [Bacteroidales bacterium]
MQLLKHLAIILIGAGICCVACEKKVENEEKYFYFEGHSYLIVKQLKTWNDASFDARSRGGYLVQITSQEEQNAVYQGILEADLIVDYVVADGGDVPYIWIGATDKDQEGFWLWDDGKGNILPFWLNGAPWGNEYNNWGTQEPDNYTNEELSPNGQNAAAIGLESWLIGPETYGMKGQWNDINKDNKIYYLVEFDEEIK